MDEDAEAAFVKRRDFSACNTFKSVIFVVFSVWIVATGTIYAGIGCL